MACSWRRHPHRSRLPLRRYRFPPGRTRFHHLAHAGRRPPCRARRLPCSHFGRPDLAVAPRRCPFIPSRIADPWHIYPPQRAARRRRRRLIVSSRQSAQAGVAAARLLRIGFQKGEPILLAAKQNRSLEMTAEPARHRGAMDRVPIRSTDAGGDAGQQRRYRRLRRYPAGIRPGRAWRSAVHRGAAFGWPGDPGAARLLIADAA